MTQHQYADAVVAHPDASFGNYTPDPVDVTSGYDTAETAPPGVTLTGHRAIWYQYVPATSSSSAGAEALAMTAIGQGLPNTMTIWDVDSSGTWTQIAEVSNAGSWSNYSPWQVTAGHRYYLRVASSDPAASLLRLVLFGSPQGDDPPAPSVPPDPNDTSQHQWQHAVTALPDSFNHNYDAGSVNVTSGFDGGEAVPPGMTLTGYRAIWFQYLPATSSSSVDVQAIAVTSDNQTVLPSTLTVFEVDSAGTWTQIARLVGSNTWIDYKPWAVTAGHRYYLRVASSDPTVGLLRFLLIGAPDGNQPPPIPTTALPPLTLSVSNTPPSGNPPDPRPDPIQLTVAIRGGIAGETDVVALDPITATVELLDPVITDTAPAVQVQVGLAAPIIVDAAVTLTSPLDEAVVASTTPDFTVALTARDESLTYTIEVEYGDPADPTSTVTLSHPAAVVDGGAILTPTSPIPATTRWRARLLLDGVEQLGWSDWNTFTVDTAVETSTLTLTWTIAADADRPIHMWHLDPPGPQTGENVTIYGHGFPSSGHLYLGETALTVQSWQLIPATAELTTVDRQINADIVDLEHFEIVFTAPAIDGPGAALTVEA